MVIVLYFAAWENCNAAPADRDFDWFWMLYEKETGDTGRSKVYRPFFLENVYEKELFQASLMPVIYWRTKTENRDEWKGFFGLFNSIGYRHENGVKDYDMGFFPLFYYGKSVDAKDKYRLIWPIGGTIKGKLAHEEISPWIFPGVLLFFIYPPSTAAAFFSLRSVFFLALSLVPVYVTYKDRDYHAWAIFWPLIQKGKSPNRDEFRILPFYAHNYKKDFYDNYSILMLFNWRKIFYKNDELNTLFALPFIGTKWSSSGRFAASTLLWPLFSWGYDRNNGDMEINMPWPLVQIKETENPKTTKRIFFPIYGLYKYLNKETFFITPLYFTMKEKSSSFESEYNVFAIIFWYFKREYKTMHNYYGRSWRYIKLWPIIQWEDNDLGDFSVNVLSLLPMRDQNRYEKMYQPFWSIFEYRMLRSGEKRLGILMRTYYQVWGKDYFKLKIPLLFTYSDFMDRVREVSFLLSMFGYENGREGRFLRLFWVPVKIGDGVMAGNGPGYEEKMNDSRLKDMPPDDEDGIRRNDPHISSFLAGNIHGDNVNFTFHFFN